MRDYTRRPFPAGEDTDPGFAQDMEAESHGGAVRIVNGSLVEEKQIAAGVPFGLSATGERGGLAKVTFYVEEDHGRDDRHANVTMFLDPSEIADVAQFWNELLASVAPEEAMAAAADSAGAVGDGGMPTD